MSELLTTRQVQDLLQVDRTTIYRMVEGGRLPAVRVGKQWRFSHEAVEAWLHEQSAGAPASREPAVPASPAAGRLADLLPLSCAQLIQDAFADVLGVTLVVTDMDGDCVTVVSNPCGFFTAAHRSATGAALCRRTYSQLAATPALEPRFVAGELGLLCARGLIRAGNTLMGMLVAGGIAPDCWPPEPEQLAALAATIGVDLPELVAHTEEVHVVDDAGRRQVLRSVQRIADIFSHISEDRNALYGRLQAIASLTTL